MRRRRHREFSVWSAGDRPVICVVPEGVLRSEIAGFLGSCPAPGGIAARGRLRLAVIPFVRQADYDPMLWACDINFVRGEDSFVRAQWAGRPLVWQIYPQEGDAHLPKLRAFVDSYCADLDGPTAAAVRDFIDAWNGSGDAAAERGAGGAARLDRRRGRVVRPARGPARSGQRAGGGRRERGVGWR